ncbi:MAG: hypothetical protein ACTH82_10715, partial [Glutamicibacter ardleyensis]
WRGAGSGGVLRFHERSGLAVAGSLDQGKLVEVEFEGPSLLREIRAIWSRNHALSATEQKMLEIASFAGRTD